MDNQRNLLLAVALSGLLILGWDLAMRHLYPQDSLTERVAEVTVNGSPTSTNTSVSGMDMSVERVLQPIDLATALSSPNRITIDAPRLKGSINLVGARVDGIDLKDHRLTLDEQSGPVKLFAPEGTSEQYFAQFGWVGSGVSLPNANTIWDSSDDILTPESPITLTHENDQGQEFRIVLSVDDNYMIKAEQTLINNATGPIVVRPYGFINRSSVGADPSQFIVHAGPMGGFGDTVEYGPDYDELLENGVHTPDGGRPDWLGFSDIYWLSALIPGKELEASAAFRPVGEDIFRADLIYDPITIPAAGNFTTTSHLFAGAKESGLLDQYRDELNINNFGKAVDWGWFEWFVKPMVWLLRTLYDFVGNFGVAIILLTVLIRGLLFPIAQKQFASMAAMKAVQPKMKAIQERYKDDKQKQQQEIMKLYKDEGVNPLAGCLPLLIQIPIFFALYKALILAIEMRHKPFVFWIEDLSAPDPAKILNLFGLLPFDPPGFLGIGILAILLGITMWATFKLNPTAMDPVQQQIFNFMPWILMFVMAPFAAGLLLYWVTSNILTLAQQSYLYSKHPQLRAATEKQKADSEKNSLKKGY